MDILYRDDDCQIYISPIISDFNKYVEFFRGQTETIINKAQRLFKSTKRQYEWLTVRAVLYKIFQHETNISYSPEGKPFLVDENYNISISHSKEYVVILLSQSHQVGIDIEAVAPKIVPLCSRIVLPTELPSTFNQLSEQQKSILLTAFWSTKEATFKSLPCQKDIEMLKDISIVEYDKQTLLPEKIFTSTLGTVNVQCFIYNNNICSYIKFKHNT